MRVVGEKQDSSSPALWIAFWLLVLVVGWMLTGGEQFGQLLLGALGAAFAAFCIWLTVRIFNRRECWAKRTAAGLMIGSMMYPLSFPIVGIVWFSTGIRVPGFLLAAYLPLVLLCEECHPLAEIFELSLSPIGLAVAIFGLLVTGILFICAVTRWFR